MIDKRFLLNTYEFKEEAKFITALARGISDRCIDIGNPCIIDKNLFDLLPDGGLIPALFPFHPIDGERPNSILSILKNNIKIINNNKCAANGVMKDINVFDFNKVKKLSEYVDEKGSIIFSLFTQCPQSAAKATNKNAIVFIDNMLKGIIDKYLYHSLYHISCSKRPVRPLGDLRFIIQFLSIPNCVPILNHRKVNGMGMIFSIVSLNKTLKNKAINTVFCMSVIMSNYKENVFIIDGINIRKEEKVEPEYIIDAKKIIDSNMKQTSKYFAEQNKMELKKKPKREEHEKKSEKNPYLDTHSEARIVFDCSANTYWSNTSSF